MAAKVGGDEAERPRDPLHEGPKEARREGLAVGVAKERRGRVPPRRHRVVAKEAPEGEVRVVAPAVGSRKDDGHLSRPRLAALLERPEPKRRRAAVFVLLERDVRARRADAVRPSDLAAARERLPRHDERRPLVERFGRQVMPVAHFAERLAQVPPPEAAALLSVERRREACHVAKHTREPSAPLDDGRDAKDDAELGLDERDVALDRRHGDRLARLPALVHGEPLGKREQRKLVVVGDGDVAREARLLEELAPLRRPLLELAQLGDGRARRAPRRGVVRPAQPLERLDGEKLPLGRACAGDRDGQYPTVATLRRRSHA